MQTKPLSDKHKEALRLGWVKRKDKGLGTPWNKGKKHSEEHREKLKQAWIKRKEKGLGTAWNKGKELPESHKASARKAMLGKKHSEETKRKMSEARMGNKNPLWKDKPSYEAMHQWVKRKLGLASEHKCKHCDNMATDWSNIDHKYRRILADYSPLCKKCHCKYDKQMRRILSKVP